MELPGGMRHARWDVAALLDLSVAGRAALHFGEEKHHARDSTAPLPRWKRQTLSLCATAVVAGCGSGGAGNVPAVSTTNGLLGAAQRSPASLVRNIKRNIASCNFVYNFQDSPDGASPCVG